MRSFWSDPYLWIHLAGLAALPLWLELCFLGLAVGDPLFPVWLELGLVAIAGIVPILWMQWQRPFYIFSLLAISLKPEKLTVSQRQLLTRFKTTQNRLLAVVVAVLLAIVLRQLYIFSPIAATAVPFALESRGLGLLVAAIAFLGSNLFLQVPVSVASVMLTSDAGFASTAPYPLEDIAQHFTQLGLPVSQLLPEFISAPLATVSPTISNVAEVAEVAAASILELEEVIPEKIEEEAIPEKIETEKIEEEAIPEKIEAEKIETERIEAAHREAIELLEAATDPTEPAEPAQPIEAVSEVEQDSPEDSSAIARIDEQSTSEVSSSTASSSTEETPETSESAPPLPDEPLDASPPAL
jgi:hypothetical protein